jgi:hypothetical protein
MKPSVKQYEVMDKIKTLYHGPSPNNNSSGPGAGRGAHLHTVPSYIFASVLVLVVVDCAYSPFVPIALHHRSQMVG